MWLALFPHTPSIHGSTQWLSTVQQLSPLLILNEPIEYKCAQKKKANLVQFDCKRHAIHLS